jgi:hypothetical protein
VRTATAIIAVFERNSVYGAMSLQAGLVLVKQVLLGRGSFYPPQEGGSANHSEELSGTSEVVLGIWQEVPGEVGLAKREETSTIGSGSPMA